MSDLQAEMNRVVNVFVTQITDLAKRAAIDTLETALGKQLSSSIVRGGSGSGARHKGSKRSSNELDKMAEMFYSYVTKHPGMRIEQINKSLGTTTKDLALPIRKLIADGELKTKGEKRSTTYFASDKKRAKA